MEFRNSSSKMRVVLLQFEAVFHEARNSVFKRGLELCVHLVDRSSAQ
jgi:hypothetical protein